ncbi:Cna B-type domain-containing protein [Varibaculum cambriense]|uniref:Cna B-type domain-containing protein n=1 Tax=Varibaculum cambriense TaxID=184870 RepID=UPI0029050AD5|nr:Cna B-type domain-containing protein [Varibaculum cambriense]MDU1223978.1 Cna B-type domain-containing protein [Varibaculum cambriense]
MLIKKKVSSVFQFLATLATLAVIVALGSTNPAAAEGVTTWDDLVAKADTFTSGSHDLTVTGDLTLTEQSKPLVVPEGVQLTLEGTGTVTGINSTAVEVKSGGKLNLKGPSFTKAQFTVNGDLNFSAGSIHDSDPAGPVIFVDGGNFTMSGAADFSKNTTPEKKVITAITPAGIDIEKLAPITVYNGTVSINGGTIKDNQGVIRGGALGIWGSEGKTATLNIKGGEITENSVEHSSRNGYGGAIFAAYTDVTISDGNIHDNFTERGGALALEHGSLVMSNGNLHDNQASRDYSGNGGALYLDDSNSQISGGTFKDNTANGWGGALATYDGNHTIDGGDFTGNTAAKSGGALSMSGGEKKWDGSQTVINGGHFANNTSQGFWGGGAIYNDTFSKLTINNALIRNNTVKDAFLIGAGNHPISKQGGGVWNCPTGQTTLNITRGVALYGNSAEDTPKYESFNGAGDDFASISTHTFGEFTKGQPVSITSRMLGGGQRLWYQDGSIHGIHSNWELAKQLPRYKEGGDNKLIPYDTEINENKAFKSVPSEDSKKLAEKLARVVIEDNFATHAGISGAGIANNGQLTFGSPGRWKLQVKKAWEGDDPEQRPTKITLDVLVGGLQVDKVELSEENNWTAAVENFPDPDTLIDAKTGKKLPITFREHDENGKQLDGYQLKVTDESKDEANMTYTVSVVNKMTTEVEVTKKWTNPNGTCPDASQIEVQLLTNGKATDKKLTLNAANSWEGKFEDLPKYIDGKLAEYTIFEVEVKGYRSEIMGDATGGFLITNKCTVPPSDITPPPPSQTTPPTTTTPPPPGDTTPPPSVKTPPLPPTGSEISAALALGILALASGAVLMRRRTNKR